MLGEKVGSLQATATVKPLAAKNSRPVFEVTAQGAGTLGSGEVNMRKTVLGHSEQQALERSRKTVGPLLEEWFTSNQKRPRWLVSTVKRWFTTGM